MGWTRRRHARRSEGTRRDAIAQIATQPNLATARSLFTTGTVSPDRQTATATADYSVPASEVTGKGRDLPHVVLEPVEADLGVAVGGKAAAEQPSAGSAAEGIGFLLAAVVLAMTFGALVAAGLPLVTALVGVLIGILGIQIVHRVL